MEKLIKVDLYRYKKDKTSLIGLIIVIGLLFFSALMYLSMSKLIDATEIEGMEQMLYSPRSIYFQSFMMGNNSGLVAIIIIAVITSRDFVQDTVRLKIINGFDKTQIYFSTLITNIIYGVGIVLGYALAMLLISSLIFGYGQKLDSEEILSLLGSTTMGILYIILYISVVTGISMKAQKIGSAVGLSIAFILVETLLASFFILFPIFAGTLSETIIKAVHIFPSVGLQTLGSSSFSGDVATIMLVSTVIFIVLANILSILAFQKSDVK